jgi:hypothetical protein
MLLSSDQGPPSDFMRMHPDGHLMRFSALPVLMDEMSTARRSSKTTPAASSSCILKKVADPLQHNR